MHEWKIKYNSYKPEEQSLREALFTLGNGYFATRGAFEEVLAESEHYPGTYLAGGYNRLESEKAGRMIENEDFVNWPNWLCINFRQEGGTWFDLTSVEILKYRHELDLKDGVLVRMITFRDQEKRETTIKSRRIVHMGDPHLAAIEYTIKPENWSGNITLRSALDGRVINNGVDRYRELSSKHLSSQQMGKEGEDGIYLLVKTNQSKIRMAQAARTRLFLRDAPLAADRKTVKEEGYIAHEISFFCDKFKPVRVEKIVSLYTSKDFAISEPTLEARIKIQRVEDFKFLLKTHQKAWKKIWYRCDMKIKGNVEAQMITRLHIFHIMQTTSFHTIDLDVGVPARGLHGEAYRGHIFWDELFIFPFLNLRIPELTREFLMYRYRRLPEARVAAREAGFRGAMFPWQSGSNGREESQVIHLNPESGRWIPDNTFLQRHVNAAIAFNVWQYFQVTNDIEFMLFYGAEMILDIAYFWSSISTYSVSKDRYEIKGVVGPDEYHTKYPGSSKHGIDNNAYTNLMAVWVLQKAKEVLELIEPTRKKEVLDLLQLEDEELSRWEKISRKMYIPFHDGDIISQFEGYEKLDEFDWEAYSKKYGNIQRLDRILESENEVTDKYKANKQADVLMLFYLFSGEDLKKILKHLGYDFKIESIQRNIDYYQSRTSHGSTLSRIIHAWVISRSDRRRSWKFFKEALLSDVEDIQKGTTSEGIHMGAMAGTIDLLQRCYPGLEIKDNVLWLNPMIPENLEELNFRIQYRGLWINIKISQNNLWIHAEEGIGGNVNIGVNGKIISIGVGDSKEIVYSLPIR
jgi:alpha,alpha-trehalase